MTILRVNRVTQKTLFDTEHRLADIEVGPDKNEFLVVFGLEKKNKKCLIHIHHRKIIFWQPCRLK